MTESQDSPITQSRTKTSWIAIASLVLAFLFPPIGFVLGFLAMVLAARSDAKGRSMGLAMTGTVVSALLNLVIIPLLAMILIVTVTMKDHFNADKGEESNITDQTTSDEGMVIE